MKTHTLVTVTQVEYLNTSHSQHRSLESNSTRTHYQEPRCSGSGAILNLPKSRFSGYTGERKCWKAGWRIIDAHGRRQDASAVAKEILDNAFQSVRERERIGRIRCQRQNSSRGSVSRRRLEREATPCLRERDRE